MLNMLVGTIGLEPTTPTMSRWCSNQLSYVPVVELAILKAGKQKSKRQFCKITARVRMLYTSALILHNK